MFSICLIFELHLNKSCSYGVDKPVTKKRLMTYAHILLAQNLQTREDREKLYTTIPGTREILLNLLPLHPLPLHFLPLHLLPLHLLLLQLPKLVTQQVSHMVN